MRLLGLGFIDLSVHRTLGQKFVVCADADRLAFVQNDDLLCMANGADALGNDEDSGVSRFFGKFSSQCCVRLEIERGETIVKDIKIRTFDESAGNRKALFLSA